MSAPAANVEQTRLRLFRCTRNPAYAQRTYAGQQAASLLRCGANPTSFRRTRP